MSVDTRLIVAELRAGELLVALTDAVNSASGWRHRATDLLCSIANLDLPELTIEALREVDARKRAAEQMNDLVHGESCAY